MSEQAKRAEDLYAAIYQAEVDDDPTEIILTIIAAALDAEYRRGIEAIMLAAKRGQLVLGNHIAVPLNYLCNIAERLLAEPKEEDHE